MKLARYAFSALIVAPALALLASASPASALSVAAFDNGWYDAGGSHTPGSTNIVLSDPSGSGNNHFFAFDLSAVSGTVSYAVLHIFGANGNFLGTDATEDYAIYDYGGSIDDLVNGTGGSAAFADLGSGTAYGNIVLSTFAAAGFGAMPDISFLLPAAALSDINAAIASGDPRFAVGGTSATLGTGQYLWHSSSFSVAAELELVFATTGGGDQDNLPVPAPGAFALFAAGVLPFGVMRARRRMRAGGTVS